MTAAGYICLQTVLLQFATAELESVHSFVLSTALRITLTLIEIISLLCKVHVQKHLYLAVSN